jgi:thymidylate synthase
MFHVYEGITADQVWLKIAKDISDKGKYRFQEGRDSKNTYEALHACLNIKNPRQRWVASRSKPLDLPFALAEVIWIMNGRNDLGSLEYFNKRLPEYVGYESQLYGAYGFRLRKHFGFDQLEYAYHALSNCAHSRQIVLQIWNANSDFPDKMGTPRSKDIPCNVTSLLKVRDGKLDWTQVMRSNDIYKGLPYNIVQFTFLQEIIAGWLGIEVGEYYHFSDSLHVYDGDEFNLVKESEDIFPAHNTDIVSIPFAASKEAWTMLNALMDIVVSEQENANRLILLLEQSSLENSFKNIACVLVADGLRRQCHIEKASYAMTLCHNSIYRMMWHRWNSRCSESVPIP